MALADEPIGDKGVWAVRLVENLEHRLVPELSFSKENDCEPTASKQVSGRPSIKTQSENADFPLVLDRHHLAAAETFSILRSRLLAVHSKLGTRSVVISSAQSGDGKTLVATNLAISLGKLGSKRILFVDGDLRAGTATRVLKLNDLPGLADYLQGKRSFESVVHVTEFPALAVVPTGVVANDTLPQMLEGPRWAEFLEQAKLRNDLVIVDSLPLSAPVADLELLTAPCDAILFVVYMRRTNRQALQRVNAQLDSKKFLGVIINNADEIYDYDKNYYNVRSLGVGSENGSKSHGWRTFAKKHFWSHHD
jgi:capsular exopolysaccharide synthesis family protein